MGIGKGRNSGADNAMVTHIHTLQNTWIYIQIRVDPGIVAGHTTQQECGYDDDRWDIRNGREIQKEGGQNLDHCNG